MCLQEELRMWKFPLKVSVKKLCNLLAFVLGFLKNYEIQWLEVGLNIDLVYWNLNKAFSQYAWKTSFYFLSYRKKNKGGGVKLTPPQWGILGGHGGWLVFVTPRLYPWVSPKNVMQPIRSSRLADYREYVYINFCSI